MRLLKSKTLYKLFHDLVSLVPAMLPHVKCVYSWNKDLEDEKGGGYIYNLF